MTERKFNVERLRSAVEWAEKEAEKSPRTSTWDQDHWMRGSRGKRKRKVTEVRYMPSLSEKPQSTIYEVTCGTSYCVAGHVCLDAGDRFAVYDWEMAAADGRVHSDMVIPKGSDVAYSVSLRAQELLGIRSDQAHRLFAGYNSIEDVRTIAEEIAAEYGEEL